MLSCYIFHQPTACGFDSEDADK